MQSRILHTFYFFVSIALFVVYVDCILMPIAIIKNPILSLSKSNAPHLLIVCPCQLKCQNLKSYSSRSRYYWYPPIIILFRNPPRNYCINYEYQPIAVQPTALVSVRHRSLTDPHAKYYTRQRYRSNYFYRGYIECRELGSGSVR